MLPIAGRTAEPIGLKSFVDTYFFQIFFSIFFNFFSHGQRLALYLVKNN